MIHPMIHAMETRIQIRNIPRRQLMGADFFGLNGRCGNLSDGMAALPLITTNNFFTLQLFPILLPGGPPAWVTPLSKSTGVLCSAAICSPEALARRDNPCVA